MIQNRKYKEECVARNTRFQNLFSNIFMLHTKKSKNLMAKTIESNKIRNPSQKKITKLATIKGNLIPASLGSIPENLILL